MTSNMTGNVITTSHRKLKNSFNTFKKTKVNRHQVD